jgi:small subunit ribosomal protein S14
MAKTSMKVRDENRVILNKKFHTERKRLKKIIRDLNSTDEERLEADYSLQGLPRDSSRSRQRHRCRFCGRSRSYNRLTGLCRIHMRSAVMNGLVPGMRKASW